MPQANAYQQDIMKLWFGNSIDDGPPYAFLKARGWTEHGGLLIKPTPSHSTSVYEIECLRFLRDEWDYDFHTECVFGADVYADAGIPIR